jgi:sec-independent protein translocase protein TatA
MPFNIGGPELVFILVIVLIVFGAGRLPEVFGQLGKGVRTFREESSAAEHRSELAKAPDRCAGCGSTLGAGAKFCSSCGKGV